MQIYVLAVGDKLPNWLEEGVKEYTTRMPHECSVKLISVSTGKRKRSITVKQAQESEQNLLLRVTPKDSYRIALDERGKNWSTLGLAKELKTWMQYTPKIALYIGGPDGFTQDFVDHVDDVWSLSSLTMPHMLVRLILVEQIYRAWTIVQGHPYHRE